MKAIAFIALVLLSSVCIAAEKIPGQIIFDNGPVNVTFVVPVGLFGSRPNIEAMQKKIRYYDAAGKKHWLRPTKAREFRFSYNGEEFRMISRMYGFGMGSNVSFLHLIVDGPVKLFEFFYTRSGGVGPNGVPTTTYSVETYLLQKGDGELKQPRGLGFKKDMAKFFADCPALVDLIEHKDFGRNDVAEMVIYYNKRCL